MTCSPFLGRTIRNGHYHSISMEQISPVGTDSGPERSNAGAEALRLCAVLEVYVPILLGCWFFPAYGANAVAAALIVLILGGMQNYVWIRWSGMKKRLAIAVVGGAVTGGVLLGVTCALAIAVTIEPSGWMGPTGFNRRKFFALLTLGAFWAVVVSLCRTIIFFAVPLAERLLRRGH